MWACIAALSVLIQLVTLVATEGGGPAGLAGHLFGIAFNLEFEDASTAKLLGAVLLLGSLVIAGSLALFGARSTLRGTTGWKPIAIILGILLGGPTLLWSVTLLKLDDWLPLPSVVFLPFMLGGFVVYVLGIVRCWRASPSAS